MKLITDLLEVLQHKVLSWMFTLLVSC